MRKCLLAHDVEMVATVNRATAAIQDRKLRQVTVPDLFEIGRFENALTGVDAREGPDRKRASSAAPQSCPRVSSTAILPAHGETSKTASF